MMPDADTGTDGAQTNDQTSGECDKAENVFHLMLLWMKSERLRKGKLKKTADQCASCACPMYTSVSIMKMNACNATIRMWKMDQIEPAMM
jgi:hypothetical protein